MVRWLSVESFSSVHRSNSGFCCKGTGQEEEIKYELSGEGRQAPRPRRKEIELNLHRLEEASSTKVRRLRIYFFPYQPVIFSVSYWRPSKK